MSVLVESDSLTELSAADGYVASSETEDESPVVEKAKATVGEDRVKHHIKRPSRFLNNNHLPNGAVSAKRTESGSSPTESHMKRFMKNSRKSRTRFGRGDAKKGGAGGKGTWGRLVDDYNGDAELDPNDPNYDSDNLENCKLEAITPILEDDGEIQEYVRSIVSEYFDHADSEDAINSLIELNIAKSHVHQVIVLSVSLAMEHKSFHREMTSVLLSDLYGRMLEMADFEKGFDVLLGVLDDLILDTPTADVLLGNFIARAVADDCLPPVYVEKAKERFPVKPMKTAIDHAAGLLLTRNRIFNIDQIWGLTGGIRPVKYLVRQIHEILEEFVVSNEADDAAVCLKQLEVPHFHHEFVYEALVKAIEDSKPTTIERICGLIKYMFEAGILTLDHLKNGYLRVFEEMPDIVLDVPYAYELLETIKTTSEKLGCFPTELEKDMPQRTRKRVVSEGDGGRFKDE